MSEKEKQTQTLNPTRDEVMQTLGGIEEATAGESLREKWGELGNLEGALRKETKREFKSEGAESEPLLAEYFRKWREDHLGREHEYKYINPDTAMIEDLTGLEIPFDFLDNLIAKARRALEAKGKETKMLNNIREFKIVMFSEPYKNFRVMIKVNNEVTDGFHEVSILSFGAEPPFDLKEVKSTYGIFTF